MWWWSFFGNFWSVQKSIVKVDKVWELQNMMRTCIVTDASSAANKSSSAGHDEQKNKTPPVKLNFQGSE